MSAPKEAGLMPARFATKTPIASKYEFTCKALIPSFSGVACIWVLLSPTAMICTDDRPLKLRIALPPQAVAGITTASTRSAHKPWDSKSRLFA